MTSTLQHLRATVERRGLEHRHLTDVEVFHLACALRGWQVTPRTPAGGRPIDAAVWLAAALAAGGRYRAPDRTGHAAELRDGGSPVDSVILMAIVQRHVLAVPEDGWDDDALAEQLGLAAHDVTRAQAVLDDVRAVMRGADPPLGPWWWDRASQTPA
jgi:hypothetical protein